jgi:hypothetical protein
MSKTPKEDTTPATKADIALVLEKLGALADDVSGSKKTIEKLEREFAEHDKIMQAQFKLVFDHIERSSEEMREHFDKKLEKLDDACFNRSVEQDSSLRDLDRRLRVVERRVGVPS